FVWFAHFLGFFPSSFSFFFLMFLLLPRSTLFPYTTLFRSNFIVLFVSLALFSSAITESDASKYIHDFILKFADSPLMLMIAIQLDRKSTRLNSSHVKISYAVFCLKKKKSTYSCDRTT